MSIAVQTAFVFVQLGIGALLAGAANVGRKYLLTRRPAAKLWLLANDRGVHIVTAQDENDITSEFTVKVYPAEYLAAVKVRTELCDVLKRKMVTLSTSAEFPVHRALSDNLICIGGPVHNRITRIMLERLQLPIHFDSFTLVSEISQGRYDAVIDQSTGKITRDIGVAVISENPFNPSSRVVLLMGCRTFGCAGAAQLVTEAGVRQGEKVFGSAYPKWAIVDVDVVDDFVARTRILEGTGALDSLNDRRR